MDFRTPRDIQEGSLMIHKRSSLYCAGVLMLVIACKGGGTAAKTTGTGGATSATGGSSGSAGGAGATGGTTDATGGSSATSPTGGTPWSTGGAPGAGGAGIPATISAFAAQPVAIEAGESSTLSWTTVGATTLSIDQGVGSVLGKDSQVVTPT